MVEKLPINWYIESPIDLEYKQYILFSYLQKVENSFINKIVSPHLLHMEKMITDMKNFEKNIITLRNDFDKNRYIYLFTNEKLEGENDKIIYEIEELIDFSIPQVQTRINHGYKILEKNKQILY
jgi:hypothetical protein